MIKDNLKNCEKYTKAHDGFAEAFAFLKKATDEKLPEGRYEIDGDRVFAFIQSYTSKTESSFEAHRNYIDIQFIMSGVEVMKVADISKVTPSCDYSAEKDIGFFEDYEKASVLTVEEGEYGIFFPWDAHKPGLCLDNNPDNVKKVVVKVRA